MCTHFARDHRMATLSWQLLLFSINITLLSVSGLQVGVSQRYGALGVKAVLRCSFTPVDVTVAHIIWRMGTHPMGQMAYYFGAEAAQQSGPREFFKGRDVTGYFSKTQGYHEITIHGPVKGDGGLYTCIVMLKGSIDDIHGSGYLTLVVLPRKHPEMRATDGHVLSRRDCENITKIPSITIKEKTVLVCHAYEANPKSIITWNCHGNSYIREINRTGGMPGEVTVASAESYVETSTDCHATIRCVVYNGNPTMGQPLRSEVCLNIVKSKCTPLPLPSPEARSWKVTAIIFICISCLLLWALPVGILVTKVKMRDKENEKEANKENYDWSKPAEKVPNGSAHSVSDSSSSDEGISTIGSNDSVAVDVPQSQEEQETSQLLESSKGQVVTKAPVAAAKLLTEI